MSGERGERPVSFSSRREDPPGAGPAAASGRTSSQASDSLGSGPGSHVLLLGPQ